jgi:hypothetical protein
MHHLYMLEEILFCYFWKDGLTSTICISLMMFMLICIDNYRMREHRSIMMQENEWG